MILAEIGKFVGAKVATAIIFLAVVAGGIWCYQNPEAVKAFGAVVKHTLLWLLVVAALPWTSYLFMRPLMARQAKMQSAYAASLTSLAVIGAYWLAGVFFAFWLADWSISGGFTWFVLILGFIAAAAYNFVICESLARHVGG